MIDNKILLERLSKIPEIKLNKHQNSDLMNGECITRKQTSRRKNVIGDISPNGNSFILYKDGKWISRNKLNINTVEETIDWIKKDIMILSKDVIQSMTYTHLLPKNENINNESKVHIPFSIEINNDVAFEKLARSCLYNWLGYGNPNGQVWFIGTEEGGAEIWRQQTKTLAESLHIRSNFTLHLDFQDVWENKYNVPLPSFRGNNVWNYMAAFLLNLENYEASSNHIHDFVFYKKLLGRTAGNHYLCELYPLPKPSKNEIHPYENIWSSIKNYHKEVQMNRFELMKNTLKDHKQVKMIVSYEKGLVEVLKQNLADSMIQINTWEYGKQKYSLFQLTLDSERTILLLSTPFFGQGQISYAGIADCVRRIKDFL